MVEQLTTKNLEFEEAVKEKDLIIEDLRDYAETIAEFEEEHQHFEQQLQDELDTRDSEIKSLEKHLITQRDKVKDLQGTLHKFRTQVASLKDENERMNRQLMAQVSASSEARAHSSQVLTRFAQLEQRLSQARTNDVLSSLARIDAREAADRLLLIRAYVPANVDMDEPAQNMVLILLRIKDLAKI
eukprot:GABV01002889.1.p1 GENE.GABV01002889.1~~GABV01002889.1.p1  ORF type:complete len:195 (+),score=70.98 GABV01002889.1:29-586(+)